MRSIINIKPGFFVLAAVLATILFIVPVIADDPEEYTVGTAEELYAAVSSINANDQTATIILTDEITLNNGVLAFTAGNTTVIGGGHTVYMDRTHSRGFQITNNATVNLCTDDKSDSLTLSNGSIKNNLTEPIIYIGNNAKLNIYEGAVICESRSAGTAAGIQMSGNSVVNMYGGTIRDLYSGPIAGGVLLSESSTFNMYGGIIERCSSNMPGNYYWWSSAYAGGGGGVCISDSGTMTMYDGILRDCSCDGASGGGVFIMNTSPIGPSYGPGTPRFTMNGGTITGCSAEQIGGGIGAFYYGKAEIYIGADAVITENTAGYYGGGIAFYDYPYEGTGGILTIADGASIYNNTSLTAGDDIMLWKGTMHLGTVNSAVVLAEDGKAIDGWYDDGNNDDDEGNAVRYSEENLIPIDAGDFTSPIVIKAAHGLSKALKVVKTFAGIAKNMLPDITISVTGENGSYTLSTTDSEDILEVSDNGLTFTWTIEVEAGTYKVTESNAEVSGYTLKTVYSEDNENFEVVGEAEITVINTYTKKSTPPVLETASHFGYLVGYPDNTIRPEGNITRAEVAVIFYRLLSDDSRSEFWSSANPFSDVEKGMWYNNQISTLYNAGILSGYPDGTFKPSQPITRAEIATIAAAFFDVAGDGYTGEDHFSDISASWANEFINIAAENGIIHGYPDGTFRPSQPITRAETVTVINHLLKRSPHKDHLLDNMKVFPDNMDTDKWYYAAVQEAANSHIYYQNGSYELWIDMQPMKDWAALEREMERLHKSD